ncbi:MAG: ABC transporter ATP-binding protein [Chitinophagales bacterium]
MVKGTNIRKAYGNLQVLKGVDIEIQKGEVVSIVGSSGAGKSTLLHILGTLDRPDVGEVTIDGQVINKLSDKNLAKFRNQKIGFVFQFHHLLPEFTALENVCIPAYLMGKNEKEVVKEAHRLLEFLGLNDRVTHKPNELSGGEQQRVAVARALINRPSVLLADEPSGNLDSDNSTDLHQLFFKLRDEFDQTFIIVTHNEQLANMADRKLVMRDGGLVL